MSTEDGFGLSEDDKRTFRTILDARTEYGKERRHTNDPAGDRPRLPVVDGERQVVELKGQTKTKVHRDDPECGGAGAWCAGEHVGVTTEREWKYRRLSVAKVWREPCSVCFPGGYPDGV